MLFPNYLCFQKLKVMKKISRGQGDDGRTLLGNKRSKKNNNRIEFLGELEELDAWLMKIKVEMKLVGSLDYFIDQFKLIRDNIKLIISIFKDIEKNHGLIEPVYKFTEHLEQEIDVYIKNLTESKESNLENVISCDINIARTICRRVERKLVTFLDNDVTKKYMSHHTLIFINRLSDYLKVSAVCVEVILR